MAEDGNVDSGNSPTQPSGAPSGTSGVPANPKPTATRQPPKWMPMAVTIGIGLTVITLQGITADLRGKKEREDAQVAGIEALAAALQPTLLENNAERSRRLLGQIAQRAGYNRLSIIKDGSVWVSTQNDSQGKTLNGIRADGGTEVSVLSGAMVVNTGIFLGENNVAATLQVEIPR